MKSIFTQMSEEAQLNIENDLKINPLTKELHKHRLSKINSRITILKECEHDGYLSIWKYIQHTPEKFYCKKACWDIYQFLEQLKKEDVDNLIQILINFNELSSLSFEALEDINSLKFHDIKTSFDDYELFSFLDTSIHPSYLKLTEATYTNLIYPISSYQRIKKEKKLEGFDVFQRVAELEKTEYGYLTNAYDNTIRNAIAHGGVIYKPPFSTIYKDKKGNIRDINSKKMIYIFDEMLDVCNGLSLGIRLFYFTNLALLEKYSIKTPLSIITEELKAKLDAPGWEIIRCFESETIDNRRQLIVFTHNSFLDSLKLYYNLFRSAFLIEKYAPNYDRYFFRLESKYALLGSAGFIGTEMRKLRNNDIVKMSDCRGILEDNSMFFKPKIKLPRLVLKLSTLISIFKIYYPLEKSKLVESIKPLLVDVRDTNIHKNGFYCVIKSAVFLKANQNLSLDDLIKEHHNLIVKKVIKKARKDASINDISRYLPVGYIKISIFSEDFRRRKLINSGLIPELMCTIEKKCLKRINEPDLLGGQAEIWGKSRIVWNRKYLNKKNNMSISK